VDFESYLISKKIDSGRFLKAEPEVWKTWKSEFDQMHPNSFTAQKLYLINPVRRKYPLKQEQIDAAVSPASASIEKPAGLPASESPSTNAAPANPKPAVPRPVFKPKPKIS
jgi:hypothetical protein